MIGEAIQRVDSQEKATGAARFATDLSVAGMLYGLPVMTPVPCGTVAVDIREALACPGVVKVVLAEDIPGKNTLGPGPLDQPVICKNTVRFSGDVVALVAAESPDAACRGAQGVRVDARSTGGIFSIEEIRAQNLLAPYPGGALLNRHSYKRGDLRQAWQDAATVVQNVYRTPALEHLYLETEACLVVPGPDGRYSIYSSSQDPFSVRDIVSQVLGVNPVKVRFVGTHMGGGFGGKAEGSILICSQAAVLAHATGRPVKMIYDRHLSVQGTTKRHGALMEYRTAASEDGRLLGLKAEIYLDKGAYTVSGGIDPPAMKRAFLHATGPYWIPNVEIDAFEVLTNNACGGQMRSPGIPQVTFAIESQMDALAQRLGLDPVDIRLKNVVKPGSKTAYGMQLDRDVSLEDTLKEAASTFGWRQEQGRKESPGKSKRRAVGVACGWHGVSVAAGTQDQGGALVFLNPGGSFSIRVGLADLGQGLRTVMTQVAAHGLGVDISQVEVCHPDTDIDPWSGKTTSSRATVIAGQAVILACQDAKSFLRRVAASLLRCDSSDVIFSKEGVGNPASGAKRSFADLSRAAGGEGSILAGRSWWVHPTPVQEGNPPGYRTYSFGTHIVELEVDVETGKVTVLRVVACHDPGKALNPSAVIGQVEGGVAMGIGFALMEQVLTENGVIMNTTLRDSLAPTSLDVPEIVTLLLETPYGQGPHGAKGVGEIVTVPTAAAVANAVSAALGIRVTELPMTAEKVCKLWTQVTQNTT
jgi:nicotinate dehydrogenase large molybdopterin subunit